MRLAHKRDGTQRGSFTWHPSTRDEVFFLKILFHNRKPIASTASTILVILLMTDATV
jgi:hypothetical protein